MRALLPFLPPSFSGGGMRALLPFPKGVNCALYQLQQQQQQQHQESERPRTISGEVGAAEPGIVDAVRTAVSKMYLERGQFPLSSLRLPNDLCIDSVELGKKLWGEKADRIMNSRGEKTAQLHPLPTPGDGCCLDHALSLGQYGVSAFGLGTRSEILQGVIGDEEFKKFALPRLRQENKLQNIRFERDGQIDEDGLSSSAELEWKDSETQAKTQSGYLGRLHLFAYAHAFHRPIIVVGAEVEGDSGESLIGVYLPLLVPLDRCHKEPLAVHYNGVNHFNALVFGLGSGGDRLMQLHDTAGESLRVPFMLEGEDPSALIRRHLNTKTFETDTGEMSYAVVSDDSVLEETRAMVTCLKNLRNPRPLGTHMHFE